MASTRISQLPHMTQLAANDFVPVVDVSDVGQSPTGSTKRLALGRLLSGFNGVQIIDSFDSLSPSWLQHLGQLTVVDGRMAALSLEPAGSWKWIDSGFEGAALTPHWMTNDPYATGTLVAEERTGGSGDQCCELASVNNGESLKYVVQYVGKSIWGASFTGRAWIRKVSEDAWPIAVKVGEYGDDYGHTVCGSTLSTEWQFFSGVWLTIRSSIPPSGPISLMGHQRA